MTGGPPDAALRLALQQRIGHTFASPPLLTEALTHSSFQGDAPRHCNERLEFVGDRVLGLVIANLLYHRFPGEEVGALARRHAALVRREALVEVAAGNPLLLEELPAGLEKLRAGRAVKVVIKP